MENIHQKFIISSEKCFAPWSTRVTEVHCKACILCRGERYGVAIYTRLIEELFLCYALTNFSRESFKVQNILSNVHPLEKPPTAHVRHLLNNLIYLLRWPQVQNLTLAWLRVSFHSVLFARCSVHVIPFWIVIHLLQTLGSSVYLISANISQTVKT